MEAESSGEMIIASTARASRAARSPSPSENAVNNGWRASNACADALEAAGLVRALKLAPINYQRQQTAGRAGCRDVRKLPGSFESSSCPSRPTAALSHVYSLQKAIDAGAREASYLTYQSILPLEATHLAAAGMRSNSVRASVVHKTRKTMGGGQQTTRNNLGDLSASWAAQVSSVSIAMAIGSYLAAKEGVVTSNAGATTALDTSTLVSKTPVPVPEVFIVTTSTRLLPHAMPSRLCANNFLNSMRVIAQSELEMGTIRSVVPQQLSALRSICNSVVDRTDGVSIWGAWVLLVHMLSDPRLRKMVKEAGVSDMEAATASLFQNYARAEVTRRARMDANASTKKGKLKANKDDGSDEDEDEDDE